MQGFTFYRGPSLLDDSPVRLVGTCFARPSNNEKTGDMAQFYILPDDQPPATKESRSGSCGPCPIISACYVKWHQGPRRVWETDYPDYIESEHSQVLQWKPHRYGAAGDPAGIPGHVWKGIRRHAKRGHTGYTQYWRKGKFWRLREFLMASCHTEEEMHAATAKGWSPYLATAQPIPGVRTCPYEATGGALRCAFCLLCDGKHGAVRITQHGGAAAINGWKTIRKEES